MPTKSIREKRPLPQPLSAPFAFGTSPSLSRPSDTLSKREGKRKKVFWGRKRKRIC
jgi:hypothetical protein